MTRNEMIEALNNPDRPRNLLGGTNADAVDALIALGVLKVDPPTPFQKLAAEMGVGYWDRNYIEVALSRAGVVLVHDEQAVRAPDTQSAAKRKPAPGWASGNFVSPPSSFSTGQSPSRSE